MTSFVKVACAAAFVAGMMAGGVATADQPSYALICTPGGGMVGGIAQETNAAGRVIGNYVSFKFARSNGGEPGSCRWADRAVRGDEPNIVVVKGDGAGIQMSLNGARFTYANTVGAEPGRSKLDFAMRGLSGDQPFTVMARNVNGVLDVTGIAP